MILLSVIFIFNEMNWITTGYEEIKICSSSSYLKQVKCKIKPGLILGLRPANETRCYKVTPSLIGWAQT